MMRGPVPDHWISAAKASAIAACSVLQVAATPVRSMASVRVAIRVMSATVARPVALLLPVIHVLPAAAVRRARAAVAVVIAELTGDDDDNA